MHRPTEGRHFIQREGPNLEASKVEPRKLMTVVGFMREIYIILYHRIQISEHRSALIHRDQPC